MVIIPADIEQSGPGVDLSNLPGGCRCECRTRCGIWGMRGIPGGMKDGGRRMKDEGRTRHGSHKEKSPALSRRRARILLCGAPRG